jgi:hypothetical protein
MKLVSGGKIKKYSVGTLVKLATNKESFWAKITKINKNGIITGKIDNDLVSHRKKVGDIIKFKEKNILGKY